MKTLSFLQRLILIAVVAVCAAAAPFAAPSGKPAARKKAPSQLDAPVKTPVQLKTVQADTVSDSLRANTAVADTVPSLDSLAHDSADTVAPVQQPAPAQRKRSHISYALTAGAAWNILVLPEVDAWEDRMKSRSGTGFSLSKTFVLDRDFENFNNSFSPLLGASASYDSLYRATFGVQYFSLTKNMDYTVRTSGAPDSAGNARLRLRGLPVYVLVSARIPPAILSINEFDGIEIGAGVFALPWLALSAQGTTQPEVWGRARAIGIMASIGTGKRINDYLYYRAQIRYASAAAAAFTSANGNLTNASLGDLSSTDDFSLHFGMLQFAMFVELHKPDPAAAYRREQMQRPVRRQ